MAVAEQRYIHIPFSSGVIHISIFLTDERTIDPKSHVVLMSSMQLMLMDDEAQQFINKEISVGQKIKQLSKMLRTAPSADELRIYLSKYRRVAGHRGVIRRTQFYLLKDRLARLEGALNEPCGAGNVSYQEKLIGNQMETSLDDQRFLFAYLTTVESMPMGRK